MSTKFLKYVFLVLVPVHVVVGLLVVPVLALAPNVVLVQPVNIYPSLVGFAINIALSYSASVGLEAEPPFRVYSILYPRNNVAVSTPLVVLFTTIYPVGVSDTVPCIA